MRLALLVAYIGDGFWGSQLQPGLRTVEGEFIAACRRLSLFEDWRSAGFAFSGRTDRGVHAFGQVCAFDTEHHERALQTLNQQLPRDCWCRGWAEVSEDFHPRYAAISRTYRYIFLDPCLELQRMQEAADCFMGTHDFSAFARTEGKNPVRTIARAEVWREEDFIVFEVTGESFLWHMVRSMATVLSAAGRGEVDTEEIERALEGDRKERYPAAPAGGLILWEVNCGISFAPMPVGERHENYREALRREHAIRAKALSMLGFGGNRHGCL